MNCENFIRFAEVFRAFDYAKEHYPESTESYYGEDEEFSESIRQLDPKSENFRKNIRDAVIRAKIFEITDKQKKLLSLTDTPLKNDEVKLPFPFVFLDLKFTREELEEFGIKISGAEIIGILAKEGTLVSGERDKNKVQKIFGKNLNLTILTVKDNGDIWFDTFNKNNNLNEEFKDFSMKVMENTTTDKTARDFTHRFFLNFLNFLNTPDVEYVEHARSMKSMERRFKKGKPIIPSSMSIRVTGKLRLYLDELDNHGHWEYGYRFWVRGHFKNLTASRYKFQRRIFVPPFIKGKGELIEKIYKVGTQNEN